MKITVIKMALLAVLLVVFYFFGGFERQVAPDESYRSSRGTQRAWLVTACMFIAGTVLALWGNQIADVVDWSVPNGFYPIIGVLLLVGGFIWMLMIRDVSKVRSELKGQKETFMFFHDRA